MKVVGNVDVVALIEVEENADEELQFVLAEEVAVADFDNKLFRIATNKTVFIRTIIRDPIDDYTTED